MFEDKVPTIASIGTAGADTRRLKSQGNFKVRLSARSRMEKLNLVLHASNVTHNLFLIPVCVTMVSLCFSPRKSKWLEGTTLSLVVESVPV